MQHDMPIGAAMALASDIPASMETLAGHDVWLVVRHPAEVQPADQETYAHAAEELGAETVRVDFEREARETTRTPEIAKEVSWKEQVRVWADNTTGVDSEHLDRALTFADELQREMRDTGMVPTPRRWRLEGLSLRGAIGVHRGTGLDEIELDLTRFEPGIIGLTGPNGEGKTTVLENMSPWPSMLTRSGSLHSHFRLRDSRREIRFRDMLTDELYRAVILIDAKTGKREHQIYRDDTPLCEDGSTDQYTDTLERLLGPRSLYLLTVVTPQKPVTIHIRQEGGKAVTATTDITSASRSERRAILRELLWLGSYQIASQQATEHGRSHGTEAGAMAIRADSCGCP